MANLLLKRCIVYFVMLVWTIWKEICRWQQAYHKSCQPFDIDRRGIPQRSIAISSYSHSAPPSLGNFWSLLDSSIPSKQRLLKWSIPDDIILADIISLVMLTSFQFIMLPRKANSLYQLPFLTHSPMSLIERVFPSWIATPLKDL